MKSHYFLHRCSSFNFSNMKSHRFCKLAQVLIFLDFFFLPKWISRYLNRFHHSLKWMLLRFLNRFSIIIPIVRSAMLAAWVIVGSYILRSQGLFLLIFFFFFPKMDVEILTFHVILNITPVLIKFIIYIHTRSPINITIM